MVFMKENVYKAIEIRLYNSREYPNVCVNLQTDVRKDTRVRPQCGQLKPRMLKIQRFWAYILDFLYKYLDISS